jgi:hypothetical protein
MKALLVGIAMLGAVASSGCIIETSACTSDEVEYNGICYAQGATCTFVNTQYCMDRTQAWYCGTDGLMHYNNCLTQCTGLAPYACCGPAPAPTPGAPGPDTCLCCMDATCSGLSCHL